MSSRVAMAIGAHPDDIEFTMAGTLLLLKQAGYEVHYMNLANGSLGSQIHPAAKLRGIRRREAQAGAQLLGAVFHPSLVDDMEVYYEAKTLRRLAAVVREVGPEILLTHSPADYMEDHQNTCRLAVSAAFIRSAPNYRTKPRRPAIQGEMAVYHSIPMGLIGQVREPIVSHFHVDIATVLDRKREALACHLSQKEWLDATQGMDSYLHTMEDFAAELGRRSSGCCQFAEGWRRHNPFGFGGMDFDPLMTAMKGNYYEATT